jgi:hypothetical protein
MPGEPGRAPPPTAVEVWPSVAPSGEMRISVSIIVLPSCVLQLAPHSPAHAARTTRGRPQLRPQDWIRSLTPEIAARSSEPDIGCGRTSPVEQRRSSMAGNPRHQLADHDHQQWSPHNAEISAAAPSAASTRPPRRTAWSRARPNPAPITDREMEHPSSETQSAEYLSVKVTSVRSLPGHRSPTSERPRATKAWHRQTARLTLLAKASKLGGSLDTRLVRRRSRQARRAQARQHRSMAPPAGQ